MLAEIQRSWMIPANCGLGNRKMSHPRKELLDELLDIVESILYDATSTDETLPPHASYQVDGDLIRQLADINQRMQDYDNDTQTE